MVTSDNPRTENPSHHPRHFGGIPASAQAQVEHEVERGRAIRQAVAAMNQNDVLIVAGKGHEDYRILGTHRIAFDDRSHVAEALRYRAEERVEVLNGALAAEATGGVWTGRAADFLLCQPTPERSIGQWFGFEGQRFDAHDHVEQAVALGPWSPRHCGQRCAALMSAVGRS